MEISKSKALEAALLALEEEEQGNENADALINIYYSSWPLEESEGNPKEDLIHLGEDAFDDLDYLREILDTRFQDYPKSLSKEDYRKNPYYALLKKVDETEGKWSLRWLRYGPKEILPYQEKIVFPALHFRELTPIGYFEEEFPYPALLEGEEIWMSIIPHEIETMASSIEEAKGKVLVYGLGLGYFAYMAAEKEEVASVTVIEKDEELVAWFLDAVLPLFPHQEKVKIIQGDALGHHCKKGEYDFLFADLWHEARDGYPLYKRLLKAHHPIPVQRFWIEGEILTYLRRYLIVYLVDAYFEGERNEVGSDEDSKMFRAIQKGLKEVKISSPKDLKNLLSDGSLKALIQKI